MLKKIYTAYQPNKLLFKNFAHLSFIQVTNALLQIILFPFIYRIVGNQEFGKIMVANSFAWLLGIVVSCGSSQSGVNDIAIHKENIGATSHHFRVITQSRLMVFAVVLCLMGLWHVMRGANALYLLLAMSIVLGEALNPLFYFVGIEKTATYNLFNLIAKLLALALVLLLIKNETQGAWVNALIGLANCICYFGLIVFAFAQKRLIWVKIPGADLLRFFKQNSYLLGNNLTVYLQQSIFLFALSATGQATLLGAYSLCDKLIWSFRLLVVALFNAIYPKGANLYITDPALWLQFKKKINQLIAVVCLGAALILFFGSGLIIHLVAGKTNATAAGFLQWMCLVPLLIALNMMNVLELLLAKKNDAIFHLGIGIMIFAAICCYALLQVNARYFGLYPLLVETVSLFLYLRYLNRLHSKQPAI